MELILFRFLGFKNHLFKLKKNMSKEIQNENEKAYQLLEKKGFSFSEINYIRNAFIAYSELSDRNISYDHKSDSYTHKRISSYSFKEENEAKFAASIKEFTGCNDKKTMRIFALVSKLSDKENDWEF
jgi:hypothetical protein